MVVKTKEEARANFEQSIAYIPDRYKKGVEKADWQTPAASEQAETNYGSAVSKAVADKSRQKAIRETTNKQWQDGAINKGAPIIGARIRGALDDWEREWGPMYDRVASEVSRLPPRR